MLYIYWGLFRPIHLVRIRNINLAYCTPSQELVTAPQYSIYTLGWKDTRPPCIKKKKQGGHTKNLTKSTHISTILFPGFHSLTRQQLSRSHSYSGWTVFKKCLGNILRVCFTPAPTSCS